MQTLSSHITRYRVNYINTQIKLDMLTMGDNPRLPNNLNILPLADNIEGVGKLLEPITVWTKPDGLVEVIRGHRRTLACQLIHDNNRARFDEIFPEGIPVFMVENCTAEEAVELKLDHTEQRGLTDPHEVQMSANMLFAVRRTEADVAWQLSSLIDKISPMNVKGKEKLGELTEKLESAKASKAKPKVIEACEKACKEFIAEYRRGYVQNLHNVFRAPKVVCAALFAKAARQNPKEFEGVYLPPLTNADVKALWKAHKTDIAIVDQETKVPVYNQTRVGPNFSTKWDEIVKDSQTEKDDKPATPKAMSAKDMASDITEGRFCSVGFVKLTNLHCGDKTVEGLDALDHAYHMLDLIAKEQPELYEMVITEGTKVESELAKADKEAKAIEG